MLTTDGERSFAIFFYDNPSSWPLLQRHQIGFNAGDRRRWTNIDTNSIESIVIFRIDGMEINITDCVCVCVCVFVCVCVCVTVEPLTYSLGPDILFSVESFSLSRIQM